MGALTRRQYECLRTIADLIDKLGYPPSVREIGACMQIGSTNGVIDHLKALEKKGAIRRTPLVSRGLIVTARGADLLETIG